MGPPPPSEESFEVLDFPFHFECIVYETPLDKTPYAKEYAFQKVDVLPETYQCTHTPKKM